MSESKKNRFESVGWTFMFVSFLVLVGPCVYGLWVFRYQYAEWPVVIGAGLIIAAILAASITSTVNWLLQKRAKKRQISRKKNKKR